MVAVSIKTKLKWILGGIFVLICLAVLVTAVSLNIRGEQWAVAADLKYRLSAPDADSRIAFLAQFGWEVNEEPVEVSEVVIPGEFNEVYEQYNAIQKEHGLDLSKHRGETCKKWVYEITNYPQAGESVRATLLIADGKVIGGDISSVALDGFMESFLGKGGAQQTASAQVTDAVEYKETMVETTVPEGAWPTD